MNQTVFVVDDDAAMRDALVELLETAGLQVEAHADGPAFLAAYEADRTGCLLLDMAMPGMTGLEVQAALNTRGLTIPTLFLTGHGDIPMAVRAVQTGAVDFLEKPIQGAALLERVQRALALDLEWRQTLGRTQDIQQHYARLSSRERECMTFIAAGLTSKEIARELGISPRTVEVHRTHVMHKMGAANLAELLNMAACCKP
ncbi:MAG: response regulator [Thiobacillus sp.]|nr:response regulator [Thiobacillus sp.]MDO9387195.1 response regulator [Thiobacillus sp.]